MTWAVKYLPEAERDLAALDNSQRILVLKAITKVSRNPLPKSEGGYGVPLGNHNVARLAGLLKIKLRQSGLRIVYKLVRVNDEMVIVVVGARADYEAYRTAELRAAEADG